MKTGKLAQALALDPKTIKSWTDMPQFSNFFSDDARGVSSTQRIYHHDDQLVINTIRVERIKRAGWDVIAALLESGYRETEMPATYQTVEGQAAIIQYAQVQALRVQLQDKQEEINQLRKDVQAELERVRKDAQEQVERAQTITTLKDVEIARLNRELGRLEAKLEMLESDSPSADD